MSNQLTIKDRLASIEKRLTALEGNTPLKSLKGNKDFDSLIEIYGLVFPIYITGDALVTNPNLENLDEVSQKWLEMLGYKMDFSKLPSDKKKDIGLKLKHIALAMANKAKKEYLQKKEQA